VIYYPFFHGDYTAATAHLTNEEDLAYRRLLDLSYDTEKPLINQIDHLARRVRCTSSAVETVLSEFFELTETGWVHSRVKKELEKTYQKSQKARESAKASHVSRSKSCERYAIAMRSHSERTATHNSSLITHTDKKKSVPAPPVFPKGLDTETFRLNWEHYVHYRKERGLSVLKPSSVKAKLNEMEAWGHQAAITAIGLTISNGWQGIFPPHQNGNKPTMTVNTSKFASAF